MRFCCTCLTSVIDPLLPQVLQPPLSDSEGPVRTPSPNSLEPRETLSHQLPPSVTVRVPSSPPAEPFVLNEQPSSQAASSPRAKHNSLRKLSSCRDPSSFPEVDFPIKYVPLVSFSLKLVIFPTASFHTLSRSLFINHPIVYHHIIRATDHCLNKM
jgi:hypothetical protein